MLNYQRVNHLFLWVGFSTPPPLFVEKVIGEAGYDFLSVSPFHQFHHIIIRSYVMGVYSVPNNIRPLFLDWI